MKKRVLILVMLLCMTMLFLSSCGLTSSGSLRAEGSKSSSSQGSSNSGSNSGSTGTDDSGPANTNNSAGQSTSNTPDQEWIRSSSTAPTTTSPSSRAWQTYSSNSYLQFPGDSSAALILLVDAQMYDGKFVFDDGQNWMLYLQSSSGYYYFLPSTYIQLGTVNYLAFLDQSNMFHVLVTIQQGARVQISDYVYISDEEAFECVVVYDSPGINMVGSTY